jgi:hypothetical protein
MTDKRIHLKVKIKNLADEARTIRKEEKKLRGMSKWELQHHRKTVVRGAARRTQIAYQMIRGRDWVSSTSSHELVRWGDWKEIARMVRKYGKAGAGLNLPILEKEFKTLSLSGDHENVEDTCSNAA